MVVVNENKPDEIREIMKNDGFDSSVSFITISRLLCYWLVVNNVSYFAIFTFLLTHTRL